MESGCLSLQSPSHGDPCCAVDLTQVPCVMGHSPSDTGRNQAQFMRGPDIPNHKCNCNIFTPFLLRNNSLFTKLFGHKDKDCFLGIPSESCPKI